MSLIKLHFQTKVIQFANGLMYNYDLKILGEIIKETNVLSSNKWKVYITMTLCHILSLSAHEPL